MSAAIKDAPAFDFHLPEREHGLVVGQTERLSHLHRLSVHVVPAVREHWHVPPHFRQVLAIY